MGRRTAMTSRLRALGSAANEAIRHAIVWIVQAFVLSATVGALTGDPIPDYRDALLFIVLVAALNTLIIPWLVAFVVRFEAWFFPLATFGINAAALLVADEVIRGWSIDGVLNAGLTALVLTGVASLMGTLLSISDDGAWRRFALGPLRARYARYDPLPDRTPGFAFLEIDGLSEPKLRRAMVQGYAPHLRAWLESGSHRLAAWECDLSSQTAASQAGILLGTNEDVPAFRWYDKAQRRVVVSNRPRDAAALQAALSSRDGLLARRGASRGNLFSGDAPDSLFTIATIVQPAESNTAAYFFFYANLYNVARTGALFVADVVREVTAALWQLARNERPRVRRFGIYPLLRAATTSLLRELSTFTVAGDLMRGVPVIYTTYIAYDEVAHHSGIDRGDTMRVLRDIDRDIGRLAAVAREAPRPYHLVVLSDHGQSQGATFRQRYGRTLGEIVDALVAGSDRVQEYVSTDEGWQALRAALGELIASERVAGPIRARGTARPRFRDRDVVVKETMSPHMKPTPAEIGPDGVIVLASGNLGLVSFRQWDHRLTLEEIDGIAPALVPGLARHPGIGFVMAHSARQGPVVVGGEGLHVLETGEVRGVDPLAAFGPRAATHLRRANGFANAPDLYVNSLVEPETGEVAAFEGLVGSHGGLGGPQTQPFVMHPAALSLRTTPVGAMAVHEVLRGWMRDARGGGDG